jgi:hypothetical protein
MVYAYDSSCASDRLRRSVPDSGDLLGYKIAHLKGDIEYVLLTVYQIFSNFNSFQLQIKMKMIQ